MGAGVLSISAMAWVGGRLAGDAVNPSLEA